MDRLSLILAGAGAAIGLMTLTWAISVVRRNASLVDGAWGAICILVSCVYLAGSGVVTGRSVLAVTLVSIWGVRLSVYLFRRNWAGGEEWRYRRLREKSPSRFPVTSLFTIFWFQGLAAIAVTLPLLAAVDPDQPQSLLLLDGIGAVLWFTGFLFEAIGDWQLARFRADPSNEGGVLNRGLWRYTRHPNYFGDAVQWWGLGLIGLAAGLWWSSLGPTGMIIVLLWVTGRVPTERHLRVSRGVAYEDYIRRTSGFLPWPPRRAHKT